MLFGWRPSLSNSLWGIASSGGSPAGGGIEQDLNNTFFIFILIHFTSMCCALIGPKRKNPNGLAMSYSL